MSTKDKQYSYLVEKKDIEGFETLGLMSNGCWDNDPRRFAFYLSRYKFVSKILEGKKNVLEIGCGDAWASRIVCQSVKNLTVSDFDSVFIEDAKSRFSEKWPFNYKIYDFTKNSYEENYDGVYLLDVFEHINPEKEDIFIKNIKNSMTNDSVLIIGIPSLESQDLIPVEKRDIGHVNCKSGIDFKDFMLKHFHNSFLFSMNDEVVHTGHFKMAHYLFTISSGLK